VNKKLLNAGFAIALMCTVEASAQLVQPKEMGAVGATGTAEDKSFHFIAGVRVWANRWQFGYLEASPILVNGAPAVRQEAKTRTSSTEFVPMPTVGIVAGRWSAAATFFPETSYDSKGALNQNIGRHEFDFNVGYSVLPGLSLSLGYHEGVQDILSSQFFPSREKIRGIVLGISGNAPINDRLSIYGNYGYGWTRACCKTCRFRPGTASK